jgi:hypothetical protein
MGRFFIGRPVSPIRGSDNRPYRARRRTLKHADDERGIIQMYNATLLLSRFFLKKADVPRGTGADSLVEEWFYYLW